VKNDAPLSHGHGIGLPKTHNVRGSGAGIRR
jgi:hypothetical protein